MKKLYLISPDREHPIPDFINMKDLPTCKSTNEFINENLDSLSGDIPLLVSADIQTEGKGRDGRKWIPVGEGGIYISYLLSVNNRENLGLLSLAAGTAVAEAVARAAEKQLETTGAGAAAAPKPERELCGKEETFWRKMSR